LRNSTFDNFEFIAYAWDTTIIEFNIFQGPGGRISIIAFGNTASYIRNNIFSDYAGYALEVYGYTGPTGSDSVNINMNSFLSVGAPTINYRPFGDGQTTLDATNNYWGTIDIGIVETMIYDRTDDLNAPGYATYLPILTAPHPDTPTGF
jgi:hypothetical protein